MQLSYAITEQIQTWTRSDEIAPIRINDGRYEVRLAQTTAEIDAALKLRFEVFNLELEEGLDSSFQTGRDRDEFDATCHHLIATDKTTEM